MKDGELLKTSCGSPNYAAPEVVFWRVRLSISSSVTLAFFFSYYYFSVDFMLGKKLIFGVVELFFMLY